MPVEPDVSRRWKNQYFLLIFLKPEERILKIDEFSRGNAVNRLKRRKNDDWKDEMFVYLRRARSGSCFASSHVLLYG